MTYRIFIVEDNAAMRSAYTQMMQLAPDLAPCGEAVSGEEALQQIGQSEADIVLVDISLPGISGLEFVRRLKLEYPLLPVVLVSGHARELYDRPEGARLDNNVKGYVLKDQGPFELLDVIRSVLNNEGE